MQCIPRIVAIILSTVLAGCGDGSQSALPDIDDFDASDEEIEVYLYTASDITSHYGSSGICLPSRANRIKPYDVDVTYRGLAKFFASNTGRFYVIENPDGSRSKDKRRTPEEYIQAFGWSSKLDELIPDRSICLPTIDQYVELGPVPRDRIARSIKARKRAEAMRATVAKDLENIRAPTEDGLYLVTKDFELIHVPALGSSKIYAGDVSVGDLPDRYLEISSRKPEDVMNIYCIKHEEAPVTISGNDLYGVYLRDSSGFPMMAFREAIVTVHCDKIDAPGFADYAHGGIGFGSSATRDSDRLIWMQGRQKAGDIYSVKVEGGSGVFDKSTVALFGVE